MNEQESLRDFQGDRAAAIRQLMDCVARDERDLDHISSQISFDDEEDLYEEERAEQAELLLKKERVL